MTRVIRMAGPTDAGAVGGILSEFIDTTPWMPRIHTRAQDLQHAGYMIAQGWVQVVEAGGAVVGFLSRDGAKVHALYVAAHARGQSHGSALLKAAQRDADHLSLWTFRHNTGAQRFYLAHGFVEVERTDGAANDEGLPDIRYAWKKEHP